jgi:Orsellinic acid/F9775 biosynthesis cluster protein D
MKILMKVMPIEMKMLIIEIEDDIEMRDTEHSIDMPLMIDQLYNLVVCDDCGVSVPFEWIISHLKDNHGIKAQIADVMRHLNITQPSMNVDEAKAWIESVWIAKAVQHIPVRPGFACAKCQHCTKDMKSMREHFSNEHRGLKASENSQQCTIQMPFKAGLQKYIQMDEFDDGMMREEEADDEGWNRTLEEEFEESVGRISISGDSAHDNLRLMGAFIAKTRWDLMMKDKDRKALIEMAATPGIKERLYNIILCGRRYIQQCCENIGNGNVMIRRLLMSAEYIHGHSIF